MSDDEGGMNVLEALDGASTFAEFFAKTKGIAMPAMSQAMAPVSAYLAINDLISGAGDVASGTTDDNGIETMNGIHDLISGGLGLCSVIPEGGELCMAASAGFGFGDLIGAGLDEIFFPDTDPEDIQYE